MADWAELPYDMFEMIVKKINLLEDFLRFGAVCRSWKIAATSNKKNLRPQIPWLMLPDKPPGDDHRQIYSLAKEDILIKNLYIPEMSGRKCIGLHYGWILTVTRKNGEVNLVHPISHTQIELPPQPSLKVNKYIIPPPSYAIIRSAALSGNPSESSDFVLMIVNFCGNVYYWRSRSKHWIEIKRHDCPVKKHDCIFNVTYYQDRFYSASHDSDVWGYKVDRDDPIVAYKINTTECQVERYNWPYIVGSTCGLLLVARKNVYEDDLVDQGGWYPLPQERDDYDKNPKEELEEGSRSCRSWLDRFNVFEFDLMTGEYKQTKNLGDRAIFVGHNTSISMDHASKFTGIKSNHIYFTDDRVDHYIHLLKGGGADMGSYSLNDDQGTAFKIEESSTLSRICPPFWFIPSL